MTTYFVSRHAGARAWAGRNLGEHLDVDELPGLATLRPGDVLCGTLPAHLAAEVVERGVRYRHLRMDLPLEVRGSELSADEMEAHGARLIDLEVRRLGPTLLSMGTGRWKPIHWVRSRWRRLDGLVIRTLALFCAAIVAAVAPGVIGQKIDPLLAHPVVFVGAMVASLLLIGGLVVFAAAFRPEAPESLRSLTVIRPIAAIVSRLPWVPGAGSNLLSFVLAAVLVAAGLGLAAVLDSGAFVFTNWMGLFAVAAGTVASLGRGLFRVEIVQVPISTCEPRPVVLMFLSNLTDQGKTLRIEPAAESGRRIAIEKDNEIVPTNAHADSLAKLLDGDSAPPFAELVGKKAFPGRPQFSWQQNFRVLESQFGKGPGRQQAGRVVVLTSTESHGQFAVFETALKRVAAASGVSLSIEEFPNVDPLRLSDMESAIRHIVHELVDEKPNGDKGRWRYDQILVDTTAGSKLTSIAGATTTFASEMVFCYVFDDEVWMLDARSSLGRN